MAPLDTGYVMNLRLVDPVSAPMAPSPADFDAVGAYLRAVRQHLGLSLDALAETTRISPAHLQGLEEANLSSLPSRPFAIGYVRAYAQALGVDGEAAAAWFKRETPDFSEPLRNPVGVKHEKTRRNPLIFGLIGLTLLGVVGWNLTQHRLVQTVRASPQAAPLAASPAAPPPVPRGPIALGAATPPPADQTMPAPYVTPGMDPAGAQPGQMSKALPASAAPAPTPASSYAPSLTFAPKGTLYGAPGAGPAVILQATKAASLIVRGEGGRVYFARQLAPGEAYRAPLGSSLSADVANPAAFDIYVNGRIQPPLAPGVTPIDKIMARPPEKGAVVATRRVPAV